MKKKRKLATGCMGYEVIGASRMFGKWKLYDEDWKKKYGHLSDKELDKLFLGRGLK